MQVQTGDSAPLLPQQVNGFGKFTVFIAEAKPSALFRALGLSRAHTFDIKIDPDTDGSVFHRKVIQPVKLPFGVNIDDAAILNGFQEGFL